MTEFMNTNSFPDAWHDRMKVEVGCILDRLEGFDLTLALVILQSATLHVVYENVNADLRMRVLNSWPEAGRQTFEMWDERNK